MILKNQKGFTLIELLVVVAIIGILAAIAIPQFAAYRQQAFCSRVESDLKNAMTTLEAFYASNETYVGGDAGINNSAGVTVTAGALAVDTTGDVTATHPNCDHDGDGTAGDTYTYTATDGRYSW
ncbi:MAG: type IV pilin protein [Candidatus Binatia bacterium]